MRRPALYIPLMLGMAYLYSLRELALVEIVSFSKLKILFALMSAGALGGWGWKFFRLSPENRVVQPPIGFRLRALAAFVFSPKVYREVMEPPLRDLYDEYCQALAEKRPWKARWVRLRGYWSFWAAFFAQAPVSLAKQVYQIWKAIP